MRKIAFSIITCLIVTISAPQSDAQQLDYKRAIANLQAIQSGAKKYGQLTPQEQVELQALLRAMKSQGPSDDASSECREAWESASSAASDVDGYARRLSQCVANGDYHDDCDSEFRRVKNAYSDYESATSEVNSYCN